MCVVFSIRSDTIFLIFGMKILSVTLWWLILSLLFCGRNFFHFARAQTMTISIIIILWFDCGHCSNWSLAHLFVVLFTQPTVQGGDRKIQAPPSPKRQPWRPVQEWHNSLASRPIFFVSAPHCRLFPLKICVFIFKEHSKLYLVVYNYKIDDIGKCCLILIHLYLYIF